MAEYDGKLDAEAILEGVMQRRNWTVDLRDALAEKLVQVRKRVALKESRKGRPRK